uniref:EF-hand domain-containing protein n=2 Tax=Chrysotila carterae TaxID=13221 RepID=A0A7S4F8L6_CHRCT
MGSLLSSAFIPPADLLGCHGEDGECDTPFSSPDWAWGLVQVLTLGLVYGYILFQASNMLSDGSELLLLVPSLSGIVGSVVLPILGAVPDGAIMLFSGLGNDAQEKLTVGVGALAGSTIMLLTVPWGLSVFLGRVDLVKHRRKLRRRPSYATVGSTTRLREMVLNNKLSGHSSILCGTGVQPNKSIRENALIILITAIGYLIIQGPAFKYALTATSASTTARVALDEHWWSLGGLIFSSLAFCWYLRLMVKQSHPSNAAVVSSIINKKVLEELDSGRTAGTPLSSIIGPMISSAQARMSRAVASEFIEDSRGREGQPPALDDALLGTDKEMLSSMILPFFDRYAQGDDNISKDELKLLLADLKEDPNGVEWWMKRMDVDRSGFIEKGEFLGAMLNYVLHKVAQPAEDEEVEVAEYAEESASAAPDDDEELPEVAAFSTPEEYQSHIKRRAFRLMALGTALILLFSDPMVDVMSNVGERVGVPSFYVAFVLAPLASNASELIASLNYAAKKTKKTITISLAALEGAACMNNTFCLAIFMGLVFFKRLAWKFCAETLAILFIELAIALIAAQPTQRTWTAFVAIALFPVSICLVAGLEAVGLD